MTSKLYKTLIVALLCSPLATMAQMDTLLFEDFQDQAIGADGEEVSIFPQGEDTIWINFDGDGLIDANDRPQSWYVNVEFTQQFADSIPAADTNFVLSSSSWLENFLPGNRNWLITPPIYIGDDQATVHWKSAAFQGPRYLDGYSVLVSTGMNFPESFTDTLFRAAQMIEPLPTGASDIENGALEVDSFNFSPGYIHADAFTLTEYFSWDSTSTTFDLSLEPHSASLADYTGQFIYLTVVHDSDDDNLISIDDLLVMGNLLSSTEEALEDLRLVTYPNPVDNYLNVLFRLEEPAQVKVELIDMSGRRVLAADGQGRLIGEQQLQLNLRRLAAGAYNMVLHVDGQQYTRKVVKR